jgi:hypothetical protein
MWPERFNKYRKGERPLHQNPMAPDYRGAAKPDCDEQQPSRRSAVHFDLVSRPARLVGLSTCGSRSLARKKIPETLARMAGG